MQGTNYTTTQGTTSYTAVQPSTMIYDANNQLVQPSGYTTSSTYATQPVVYQTQAGGLPSNYQTSTYSTVPSTLGAPLAGSTYPVGQTGAWSNQTALPVGQTGAWSANQSTLPLGQQNNLSGTNNQDLPQLPNPELELRKRMLENDRETQLKYADMESDKQKKFEDKAEKQREKAAKWKGRGMESMVHRHEKKATGLELKAHEHFLAAEQYRAVGKTFELERKTLDPPAEKKDDKKGAKKSTTKPGDKPAEEKKDANATASDKSQPAAANPAPATTAAAPAATPAAAPATTAAAPAAAPATTAAAPAAAPAATTAQPQDLPTLTKKADDLAQALHQQQNQTATTGVGKQ